MFVKGGPLEKFAKNKKISSFDTIIIFLQAEPLLAAQTHNSKNGVLDQILKS